MSDEAPHVLVVDDDKRLRELLRKFLSDKGFLVTLAADAAEARARMGSVAFDVLVLDVMMPGETGTDLAAALRAEDNSVPILMLTAMGEADDRIAGFESGADDYLTKPFDPRELVHRLNSILRRVPRPEDAPRRLFMGGLVFDLARDELRQGDGVIYLTSTEGALLRILAENAGQALSREDLATRVGGGGGGRNIDVLVTRLRRKIEPDPRQPRYLQTARGLGYLLRPD